MDLKDALKKFDIDDPILPPTIKEQALISGEYPYEKKLKTTIYAALLVALQIELVKLQTHLAEYGDRIVVVFEGRDAAGKGGTIKRYTENLNPRHTRVVALTKPSDKERDQWYFQRYVANLPVQGETALFDRSWYNRAGVEPVMGFCTPEQTEKFLIDAPNFESMLVDEGFHLFKFWLNIGRPMQIKRFHDRRHSPLKSWKLSPIDLKSFDKWGDYSEARDTMFKATHTSHAPWHVVRANDKRRSRLFTIATVLNGFDYAGKDHTLIADIDDKIVMTAPDFLEKFGHLE